MTEQDTERAEAQAKAQLSSIRDMVEQLRHSQECEGCDDPTYAGGADDYEYWHDQDGAQEVIESDPLEVSVRSDWHTLGDKGENTEYKILLCTGGPAVRIVGTLGAYNEPETAHLEYQDWFTPWVEYPLDTEEEQVLLEYARVFYFGDF